MPAKYYIYAGGRWCEVDTRRGRVSGWRQRARFCFLRGGRLEVARTARVLRALRALATGAGGAARDAAPLRRRPQRSQRESAPRMHHCCSQHLHHSRCDLNANELSQKPPGALPASTPLTAVASPRKRKSSTSEESHSKAKRSKRSKPEATKTGKQNKPSPQKSKTSVRVRDKEQEEIVQSLLQSSSSEDNVKKKQSLQKSKTTAKVRSKDEEDLVQNLLQSSSDDTSNNQTQSPQKSKTGIKRGINVKKPVHTVLPRNSSPKSVKQKTVKQQSPQMTKGGEEQRLVQSLLQSTPLADARRGKQSPQKTKSSQKTRVRGKEEEKIVQSLLQSSSSEDTVNESETRRPQPSKSKSKMDSDKSDSSSSDSSVERREQCKELVIDDDVVAMLRKFLERGADDTDLERFDRDEEYKTSMFYKLNPLVVVNRCVPLENLLLQRLSINEFAKQLGLRSVADVTPEKRYRMRHSTRLARIVTSDSETAKENVVRPKRRQLWNRDKELFNSRSSRSSEVKDNPEVHKPVKDSSRNGNDSEAEVKRHIRRHLERRISTRGNPVREEEETTSKKAKDDDDSVVISDDSDSDTGESARDTEGQGKSRKKKDSESVVVSDETVSDVDNESRKSTRITRASVVKMAENESVVVSDESNSNTDANQSRSTRRTRSQGPDKRVLTDQKKVLVISDDTDSNTDENRNKSRTKSKAVTAKARKSVVDSDESTDGNRGENSRPRSRDPDRTLKEQNRSVETNTKKDNDTKARKEVDSSTQSYRTTRSSMKGTDDKSKTVKENDRTESAKKVVKPVPKAKAVKRKEDKPGPAKKELNKGSKITEVAPIVRGQDKSVVSDSDSAFETSELSPNKNQAKVVKQQLATSMIRSAKGRFVAKKNGTGKESKENNKNNEKHRTDKEKVGKETNKSNEKHRTDNEKVGKENDKNNEKHRTDNEKVSKEKSKANDKQRVETDKEESEGSDKHGTGKENYHDKSEKKLAAARNMLIKPVKVKKSSVANGREYTSLEDHAIVAWLSLGGRERMVNGNAIWRELQLEYHRLTSQTRSWHSLRNRYLRYILPSLGALALPPAQMSRLRAAAATGKLKSCGDDRRNSIFNAPRVRSAANAGRVRPRPDSDHDDKRERTPPSPRRARPQLPSPAKPSPSKRTPSPTHTTRLRVRTSTASAPTPQKKRRIHHL